MAHKMQHARGDDYGIGWIYFAGLLLLLSGIFHAITGLVAIFKDQIYLVNESTLLVLDYSGWGWAHLILGIILFFVSFSLLAGSIFGRIAGVVLAALSIIANFTFISAFPLWSLLITLLDLLIIYGILVHGSAPRKLAAEQGDMPATSNKSDQETASKASQNSRSSKNEQ
jgi:hypothetical protein